MKDNLISIHYWYLKLFVTEIYKKNLELSPFMKYFYKETNDNNSLPWPVPNKVENKLLPIKITKAVNTKQILC